jgi:ferric-dicitrate binding protein FerR (iron transport regulator)
MNNQDYIEKWIAGTLSEDERASFEQTEDFRNLQRMDNALKMFKPMQFDATASFEKIKSRRQKEAKVVSLHWPAILRIAAVLILGLSVLFYFSDTFFGASEVIYTTGIGETREIILPDKSIVNLNAKSSIAFSEDNWEDKRLIKLEGEAFFSVQKGERFEVITNSGTVTVLGTQFNVKDRNEFYEVVCYEGKVQVTANASPVQLTAKQSYREVQQVVMNARLEITDTPAWLINESAFESVPYLEVLNELERQYEVTINTKGVDSKQLYTGRFPNKDLITALKAVTLPFGLTYQINGNEILVLHGD